jgi:FAD/FMN-containing dehydrogenase
VSELPGPGTGDQELAEALGRIVGSAHVVTDPALLAGRVVDWTGRWRGACALSVAPGNGDEVARVLTTCAGRQVVVQGGNTGLVGGGIPQANDVLLLTHRLDSIEAPDVVSQTVAVGAGVTLAALQERLAPYGLELGVDIASRESASIGGMAATNAGGQRVLRDGAMRRQVLSVDAYDVQGRQVAVLHDLIKDNTGYDLSALLVGSEGTLAVITRVLLKVIARVPATAVVLAGLPDLAAVGALVARVRRERDDLRAVELVSVQTLVLVGRSLGQPTPVSTAWTVLFQFAGRTVDLDGVAATVMAGLIDADASDAPTLVATDPAGMRGLWAWRDRATESIAEEAATTGQPLAKLDVSLPGDQLPMFVQDLTVAMEGNQHRLYLFGHVGDGNVHVNLIGPDPHSLEDWVYRRVAGMGGSISAEHGIGRAKAAWFALVRSETERTAMRAVKDAWDPEGRLGRAIWVSDSAERTNS